MHGSGNGAMLPSHEGTRWLARNGTETLEVEESDGSEISTDVSWPYKDKDCVVESECVRGLEPELYYASVYPAAVW